MELVHHAEINTILDKPCYTCLYRRCKMEVKNKGHITIWGCAEKRIRFGYQWDYEAGTNMPVRCEKQTVTFLAEMAQMIG